MVDEIRTNLVVGAFAAVVLSPALIVTIPTIIPALAVTFGRKTRYGIEQMIDQYYEEKDGGEGRVEEGKGGEEGGKGKEKAE